MDVCGGVVMMLFVVDVCGCYGWLGVVGVRLIDDVV